MINFLNETTGKAYDIAMNTDDLAATAIALPLAGILLTGRAIGKVTQKADEYVCAAKTVKVHGAMMWFYAAITNK